MCECVPAPRSLVIGGDGEVHFLPGDSPRDGGDASRYGEPLPGNGRWGGRRVVDDFTTRQSTLRCVKHGIQDGKC